MLPNNRLRDLVVDIAQDLNIPLQFNVLSGYGQDGAAIQKTGAGVPAINVTVPTRYLHSHTGVIQRDDVKAAKKLGWKENKPEVKKKAKKNAKRA